MPPQLQRAAQAEWAEADGSSQTKVRAKQYRLKAEIENVFLSIVDK
jgi:hypothetical protein